MTEDGSMVSGAGQTLTWVRGTRAIDACLAAGTVVATFDASGHYNGHSGIAVSCSATQLVLFDSNWIDTTQTYYRHVGRHTFTTAGATTLSKASNYYVVLAP